jgi:hypothetical protein
MDGVVVDGAGGDGVVIHYYDRPVEPWQEYMTTFTVRGATLRGIDGAGLRIVPDGEPSGDVKSFRLIGNRIESTGGQGIAIEAQYVECDSNVVTDAGGHGFNVRGWGEHLVMGFARNTVVGCEGDGVRVEVEGAGSDTVKVRWNIAALNAGDGVHIAGEPAGTVHENDAWLNYGVAYAGVPPSEFNLVADPVFCDPVNGDFTVSSVSPCRPDGPFGQIGALGVGCTRLADAVPAGRVASVFPNPARGAVTLRAPWTLSGSRVDVFDIQGRCLWTADAPAGGSVTWEGVGRDGKTLGAGLYWVRFTSGVRTEHRRLAWLR